MQNLRTVINAKPSSHFGSFSNKCTKSKKLPLKSDTITYLYGFNGKEKDKDITGYNNSIIYEYRVLDVRIAKYFSTDPREKEYSWQSTYAYFRNCPITIIDFLGGGGGPGPKDSKKQEPKQLTTGKAAHRVLKKEIRKADPKQDYWKAERNADGSKIKDRPDLRFLDKIRGKGGVWELKSVFGGSQAHEEAIGYCKILNRVEGKDIYKPGSDGGAPTPPIIFGKEYYDDVTKKYFSFYLDINNSGAILYTVADSPEPEKQKVPNPDVFIQLDFLKRVIPFMQKELEKGFDIIPKLSPQLPVIIPSLFLIPSGIEGIES
jgi:RHS repeat-associated protein